MHDRPDHVGAMGGASLTSLASHGHRRTGFAAPEGRCMIALTMRGQCKALRSSHGLLMDIGGHVPPLLELLALHTQIRVSNSLALA